MATFATAAEYSAAIADPSFDVKSPPDGAVFYSDDHGENRARAEQHAMVRDALGKPTTTLERTPGGKWLDDEELWAPDSPLSSGEARAAWNQASGKYASQAQGDCRCFVTGSDPQSVFRKIELETLVNNPKVTALNGVPRSVLAQAFAADPEQAFKMVEQADIALRASAPAGGLSMAMGGGGGGKPAARVTDMHVCPMVTPGVPPVPHVGGPIIPPCSPNVITGMMPQARVTDQCICVGPLDAIVQGSTTVFVNGLPAARIGDLCMHGGQIVTGFPTVLIGG